MMWRSTRIFWALVLCFLAVYPAGEAIGDTIALRDGTKLEGIVGNRDILAGARYAVTHVTILVDATGEFRAVPVDEILYVLLVDGDEKRLVDFQHRPTETPTSAADSSQALDSDGLDEAKREVLRLGLGPSFPVYPSDFENGWRMGWSGTLRLSFRLNSATRVNFGFEYNRYTIDSKPLTLWESGPSIDGGSVSVFYLPAEIELRPRGAARHLTSPYFVLGAGYYRLDLRDASVYVAGERHTIPGDWEHALGFHIGLGISAGHWFVEGLAVYGLTDVDPTGHWAIRVGMQIADALP